MCRDYELRSQRGCEERLQAYGFDGVDTQEGDKVRTRLECTNFLAGKHTDEMFAPTPPLLTSKWLASSRVTVFLGGPDKKRMMSLSFTKALTLWWWIYTMSCASWDTSRRCSTGQWEEHNKINVSRLPGSIRVSHYPQMTNFSFVTHVDIVFASVPHLGRMCRRIPWSRWQWTDDLYWQWSLGRRRTSRSCVSQAECESLEGTLTRLDATWENGCHELRRWRHDTLSSSCHVCHAHVARSRWLGSCRYWGRENDDEIKNWRRSNNKADWHKCAEVSKESDLGIRLTISACTMTLIEEEMSSHQWILALRSAHAGAPDQKLSWQSFWVHIRRNATRGSKTATEGCSLQAVLVRWIIFEQLLEFFSVRDQQQWNTYPGKLFGAQDCEGKKESVSTNIPRSEWPLHAPQDPDWRDKDVGPRGSEKIYPRTFAKWYLSVENIFGVLQKWW